MSSECYSCQEKTEEPKAKQAFPESNLHFKFWLGTDFRANAVFGPDSFQRKIAWEGVVETFDLKSHPKAKRCYAWSFTENGEQRHDQ